MDDGGGSEEKGGKKSGRSAGERCMVMNCGSTHKTAPMHKMPGPFPVAAGRRLTPVQMGWISFINRKRVFDHHKVKNIVVCGRHFDESQYDSTQMRMHRMGLRKLPPRLLPNAIPHIEVEAPVPPTSTASETRGPSSDSDEGLTVLGVEPSSPPTSASASPSSIIAGTRKRPRPRSSHFRKKEVSEIVKTADEKRASYLDQDILERSKGHQISVKMVNCRVGNHKRTRACKVQVRPITVSRGSQSDLETAKKVQLCDADSQTTESSFAVSPIPPQVPEGPEAHDGDFDDEFEEPDDEVKDPTYTPSPDEDRPQTQSPPTSIIEEEKFIVFESQLMSLFSACVSCQSKDIFIEKFSPRSFGSQLKVAATCWSCGHVLEWQSQPKIGNVMAGNLLLSAAILFSGGSPAKMLRAFRHMNLKAISMSAFLEHQRDYLQPAIIQVHAVEEAEILAKVKEKKVVLGGDGRADSPGHSAKYGSYTLMDMTTKKILDVQLVQSNEVTSSNAMEKEGLSRGLSKLHREGVQVGTLITDRHCQVAKWLRENFPDIDHRYDVWHIVKGLKKKLTAVSRLKDCEVVGRWKRSIVNHVYWCASSTPDGDGTTIEAKYKSILNHVRNLHDNHGVHYPRCSHGEQYSQREWMKQGSKAFEKMSEEMTKTRLLNDLKKMSPHDQTSSVEAYHSVLLYWCPKMLAYSYAGMKCRLLLATMHWNENAGRAQATKADGTPVYRINYPKAKEGGHTVSRVLTSCTFNYVKTLMEETEQLVSRKQKLRSAIPELQPMPALCSGVERPNKEEAIKQAEEHRRFSKD